MIKQSNTALILIHEIYGLNAHMQEVKETFTKQNVDVFCPNLLKREAFDYAQEEMAYRHFVENVGFEKAADRIKVLLKKIAKDYETVYLLGFSVGATIAWLCSEEESVDAVVGYYGSRIRDYLTIVPAAPTLLIFPEEEKSFSVDELIATLNQHKINTLKYNGPHGFSDPYSIHYKEESARDAYRQTLHFFKRKENVKE